MLTRNEKLDFYNIKENRIRFSSGTNICAITAGSCSPDTAQRSITFNRFPKAADNSYENLITACLHHNSQRGSQPLMDYLTRKQDAQEFR